MAATITPADVAAVLRAAADTVAALPYARVVRTDVHRALREAGEYGAARDALLALYRYLRAVGGLELLTHWARPSNRDGVAADLRAAADAVEQAAADVAEGLDDLFRRVGPPPVPSDGP